MTILELAATAGIILTIGAMTAAALTLAALHHNEKDN